MESMKTLFAFTHWLAFDINVTSICVAYEDMQTETWEIFSERNATYIYVHLRRCIFFSRPLSYWSHLGEMGSKLLQLSSQPWMATIGHGPEPQTLPAIFPIGRSNEISSHFEAEEWLRWKRDLGHPTSLCTHRTHITGDILRFCPIGFLSLKFNPMFWFHHSSLTLYRKVYLSLSEPVDKENLHI